VALGLLSVGQARAEVTALGPTVGFLAAVLVLAWLCQRDGLFDAVGDRIAAASGGRPVVLLALVFLTCSTVTAALSLDTTVVLLTPVIFATVSRLRVRPGAHLYACVHLSNSASLLAPVSNLTNLLAFAASGLCFLRFTALMTAPGSPRSEWNGWCCAGSSLPTCTTRAPLPVTRGRCRPTPSP